jgi:hypothetical protein
MGQFKPMVKMMTTEPSIELKLKKGGAVENPKKMMNGGVMSGLAAAPTPGARGGMAPAMRPKKPTMAARRAAMMGMKEGGDTALQKHAAMPASKAHKGLKTGGVVMGQGGFKEGGIIKSTKGETKMVTAQGEHHTPKKTGEVKMGNAGGYKKGGKACYAKGGGVEGNVSTSKPGVTNTTTGEVKKGNAGGYKKGGKAKKMAYGGTPSDLQMETRPPQIGGPGVSTAGQRPEPKVGGREKPIMPPEPEVIMPPKRVVGPYGPGEGTPRQPRVAPDRMIPERRGVGRGIYRKEGGAAKKAFAAGGSVNDSGRPVAYPAKPVSKSVKNNLQSGTFKHGGSIKMNKGGIPAEAQSAIKQADAERAFRDYEKAEAAENKAMRDSILGAPKRMFEAAKGLFKGKEAPSGSVTKTEKSVTVTPSKKRGGSVKC